MLETAEERLPVLLNRRTWLGVSTAGLAAVSTGVCGGATAGQARSAEGPSSGRGKPTRFQIACMTLPYSRFPLHRALDGHQGGGLRVRRLGHDAPGGRQATCRCIAADAPPERAKDLASRCRDMGLEPVMMFSRHLSRSEGRPRGADAAHPAGRRPAGCRRCSRSATREGGNQQALGRTLQATRPDRRDNNVLLVVKQHGGETGTGEACAAITREVNHATSRSTTTPATCWTTSTARSDPPDLQACASEVRSFCIKDHRFFPKTRTAAPASARSTTTSCCTRSRSPG